MNAIGQRSVLNPVSLAVAEITAEAEIKYALTCKNSDSFLVTVLAAVTEATVAFRTKYTVQIAAAAAQGVSDLELQKYMYSKLTAQSLSHDYFLTARRCCSLF